MGQGIRALCEKDWAVRVVFGGEEVYSSPATDFKNCMNRERINFPEETLFFDNMSAPWFILPGTCVAFSADCSEPTQEGRSPACRVASRRGRPGDLCMTPRTCCLCVY